MPLRDHFHGPDSEDWPWAGVHGTWITMLMLQLNTKVLPRSCRAVPHVHLGSAGEIDIANVEVAEEDQVGTGNGSDGGVATAVWAPPKAALTAVVDYPESDIFEVRVHTDTPRRRLVAVIELVSPANKDRPTHRQAFVAKCASYLYEGVGLVIIDVVTSRLENLHAALMELLDAGAAARDTLTADLYCSAYRPVGEVPPQVEIWPVPLTVGAALPTLPLWLGEARCVPLDLETTYQTACQGLRLE